MTERNRLLQERIENFAVNGIGLTKVLSQTLSNRQIFSQFIDSITSVGANYHEACEAESAKDFVHKLKISRKENEETGYWLRILKRTNPEFSKNISVLEQESLELNKIFSSIINKFKTL